MCYITATIWGHQLLSVRCLLFGVRCFFGISSGILAFCQRTIIFIFVGMCVSSLMAEDGSSAGKVADPARGQLNKENEYFPVPIRS